MNNPNASGYDFSILHHAFSTGIYDSVNPCNFAAVLILILILSRVGRSTLHIILFGGLYVALAGITQYTLVWGVWDPFLTMPAVFNISRSIYLLLAIVFLILGIFHAFDWWGYKKHKDIERFKIPVPGFFQVKHKDYALSLWWKIIFVVICVFVITVVSVIMTALSSHYPQSEYLFILYSHLMAGGDKSQVIAAFAVNSLAMMSLMLFAWMILCVLAWKKKRDINALLYFKGIMSALFLSTGIGLVLYFL